MLRLPYWLISVFLTFFAGGLGATIARHATTRRRYGRVTVFILSWLSASILVTVMVLLVNLLLFDFYQQNPSQIGVLAVYCFAITFAVILLFYI